VWIEQSLVMAGDADTFTIVSPNPKTWLHAGVFSEITEAFVFGLRGLGFTVDVTSRPSGKESLIIVDGSTMSCSPISRKSTALLGKELAAMPDRGHADGDQVVGQCGLAITAIWR
jgi:hypothetical protein